MRHEDRLMKEGKFPDVRLARHKGWLWVLAFAITAASVVYQRRTGPTYPLRGNVVMDGKEVAYSLLRTYTVGDSAPVTIQVPDTAIVGVLRFRRFKSNDDWTIRALQRKADTLVAHLPEQPPAGKVMYFVTLEKDGEHVSLSGETPVILRYKGYVPAAIVIPHVLLMFMAMLMSTRTGLEALDANGRAYRFMLWTIGLFFIGGFILGPLMQKFAFGAFWTGIPFGKDLTDNKTLIAMLGWVWAWFRCRKGREGRGWIVMAAVLMLVVYLIPHSVLGSELDFTQMNE